MSSIDKVADEIEAIMPEEEYYPMVTARTKDIPTDKRIEDWEKRFNEQFVYTELEINTYKGFDDLETIEFFNDIFPEDIRQFIKQEIKNAEKRVAVDLIGDIEKAHYLYVDDEIKAKYIKEN